MATTAFNAFWDGPDKFSFHFNAHGPLPLSKRFSPHQEDQCDSSELYDSWSPPNSVHRSKPSPTLVCSDAGGKVTAHIGEHTEEQPPPERDVCGNAMLSPPDLTSQPQFRIQPIACTEVKTFAQTHNSDLAMVFSHDPAVSPETHSSVLAQEPAIMSIPINVSEEENQQTKSPAVAYQEETPIPLIGIHLSEACRVPDCLICNRELPECLLAPQPSWATILRVVFYSLRISYPQKDFFNLRNHVYEYVDAHWDRICIGKTRSEHWKKQLQDTLAHNKKLFASGADIFKQKGFWKLECQVDPWEEKPSSCSSAYTKPEHAPPSDESRKNTNKQRPLKRLRIEQNSQ